MTIRAFVVILLFVFAVAHSARADRPRFVDPDSPVVQFFMRHPELMTARDSQEQRSCPNGDEAWNLFLNRYAVERSGQPLPCDDLVSVEPPALLRASTTGLISRIHAWWPVCSLASIRSLISTAPEHALEPERLLNMLAENVESLDSCGSTIDRTSVNFEMGIHPDAMRPPSRSYQESIRRTFEDASARISEVCCRDDRDCRSFFERAQVRTCSEHDSLEARRNCALMGAYQRSEFDQRALVQIFGDGNIFLAQGRRLTPGVELPMPRSVIYLNHTSFSESDLRWMLTHELMHTCSAFWTTTVGRATGAIGDRLFFERFAGEFPRLTDTSTRVISERQAEWRYCRIGEAQRAFYLSFSRRLGMSDEVFRCLENLAGTAALMRFDPSRTCDSGCPVAVMEENVAQWGELVHSAEGSQRGELIGGVLDACDGIRDGSHPLQRDVLACAMLDAGFRNRVVRGLRAGGYCR